MQHEELVEKVRNEARTLRAQLARGSTMVLYVAMKDVNLGKRVVQMPFYILECGHDLRLTPAERGRQTKGIPATRKVCPACRRA